MKLKLAKMIKNFVKILELLGDRLEVCVSVFLLCTCITGNVSYANERYPKEHEGIKSDMRIYERKPVFGDSGATKMQTSLCIYTV